MAPLGAAALFLAWQAGSWKGAVLLGWLAGLLFFTLDYRWVGYTVGHAIGAFGPFVPLGPAIVEAPFLAFAGGLAALGYARVRPSLAPLAAAAGFTLCEWLRSIGPLGAPFDQLGYTQAGGPLRALAAYAGTYGVTLALCIVGAYLADALYRRTLRPFAVATIGVIALTAIAWMGWPVRTLAAPTIRVAAVQGNIAQSLKWNSPALAVRRYLSLTQAALRRHPRLIVWPESVIPEGLNRDPRLMRRIAALAHGGDATIVAGSLELDPGRAYNALYVFNPDGTRAIYRKRQLVPFAESFPGRAFLGWLPYVGALNGGFSAGHVAGVYPTAALPIGPLICWESAFADLAHAQVARGAQLLIVSTDDAWFGRTSGPYMHAQIAQLRAIENGRYLIRAAATGISGIIAPDGTWQRRSRIDTQTIVFGKVGPPVATLFAAIGPRPVALAVLLLYLALVGAARRRDAR